MLQHVDVLLCCYHDRSSLDALPDFWPNVFLTLEESYYYACGASAAADYAGAAVALSGIPSHDPLQKYSWH